MKSFIYPRLALSGIKKNYRLYLPYIFACTGMMTIFYITAYLANSEFVANQNNGTFISIILRLGWIVLGAFSAILLFYTSSFLMKRRKTEFGLYNILGMSKTDVSFILIFENIFILAVSLIVGISLGILFSKLMEILLINMVGGENTAYFYIDFNVIFQEIVIYSTLFAMILFKGVHQVSRSNAITLFQSTNAGEKPPKANLAVTVIGLVLLIAGYVLANIVKNPIYAVLAFFGAVILVIAATYLLFISGSVVLCRLLQKNKKYYYKTNHFFSTSQMAFRMKRNGSGLASICILATMALVTISSTSGLYFGLEQTMRKKYPRDAIITADFDDKEYAEKFLDAVYETAQEYGTEPKNTVYYRFLDNLTYYYYYDNKLLNGKMLDGLSEDEQNKIYVSSRETAIYLIPVSDYNSVMGTNLTVNEGEAIVLRFESEPKDKTIDLVPILGEPYTEDRYNDKGELVETVKQNAPEYLTVVGSTDNFVTLGDNNDYYNSGARIYRYVFINDKDYELQYKRNLENRRTTTIEYEDGTEKLRLSPVQNNYFGFDIDCDDETMNSVVYAALNKIRNIGPKTITDNGTEYDAWIQYRISCVTFDRKDYFSAYSGLLFLGVIFCTVFILSTVMIMYYKQVTEGYEDKSKFEILQKVGMTKSEIRSSINSQVLTLFFVPLAAACVHIAFALPLISRLLLLLGQIDNIIPVTLICILIYAVVYILAYISTSRIYYKIIS